ncbi:hypothetical protein HDU84_006260 [Entophlyctis sp. JEL0112]|nr:hypothetical protein HDU84_006260 [Entophlyctis sp. JEL0112]
MPTLPTTPAAAISPVAAASGLHLLVETIGSDRSGQRTAAQASVVIPQQESSRARSHSPPAPTHPDSKRRRLSDEAPTPSSHQLQQSQANDPEAHPLRQSIGMRRSRAGALLSLSTGPGASGSPPAGSLSSQSSQSSSTVTMRPSLPPPLPSPSTLYPPSHLSFMPQSAPLHQQQYAQLAVPLVPPPTPTAHVPSQSTPAVASQVPPPFALSKRAFVSLFESVYDSATDDIPTLTARLKEQLRSSATLLQTLQASGNMIEELVRSCFGESYRAHLDRFERGLADLSARVSAVEQREQISRDELSDLRERISALEGTNKKGLER